jgi:hypothetical protein
MLTNGPHPPVPTAREGRPTAPALRARASRRPRLSDERGYSLIELLVAMVSGITVCFALFAILDITSHQTSRLTNYTQANQQGRLAMTKIVDALHSACVTSGFTPIWVGSGANELKFVNAYSEEAVIPKSQFAEQRIVWNKETETLTDYTYPAIKEISWPNFEYSSTASPSTGVLLARNVVESETGGKKVPIFQYYGYTAGSTESATTGLSTLSTTPLEVPLTEKTAPTAASVLVSFSAGPNDGTVAIGAFGKGVRVGLQTQVTLSFTVPISNEKDVDAPCQ